ncbi:zinc ribbon domain-containing protein [Streptomyces pratisoli]|uniref:zinc ribbon domain-containing protein n=1 Tax=Streptomyces TaxID=1883 RepID=UPI003C12B5E6
MSTQLIGSTVKFHSTGSARGEPGKIRRTGPNVRVWTCGACGAVLDRDINAAVNVAKAAGLAVSACGALIRPGLVPAPRGEAGTHSTPQPSAAR